MAAQILQPAYVLHSRRYGDSSLIVDLLVREQGRVACIAKGVLRARRPGIRIQPFQPLLVDLRGRGEVLTLTHAESSDVPLQLNGRGLFCGLYLNELLIKLTARHDPCPQVFDDYAVAILALGRGQRAEPLLRRFEVRLMLHLGLGLGLQHDVAGHPIVADRNYIYDVDSGARPASSTETGTLKGATLHALQQGHFDDENTLLQARQLMRRIIDHHLGGRPLRSRELFR